MKNRRWDSLKLVAFLVLVYAPFLGFRVARMAGDEKAYVAQALEMEQAGTWFLQRFAGQAEYIKGPLHYILLRLGSATLGHTMWATVYMNLLLLLVGAYSLYRLAKRHLPERPPGLALFAGAAFGVSAGIYGFVFASQMELELASFFAIAINLWDRSRSRTGRSRPGARAAEWGFWAVVGLAGWIKSPLYSALLGASAVLAHAIEGDLGRRSRSRAFWLPLAMGVLVCAAGYLPAFLWDREAYLRTYWLRETFQKGGNGGTWYEALLALTTSFLFPWVFLAFWAYLQRAFDRSARALKLENVCIAWLLPTVVFFALHPYHGQSYNVPVIGPLILWISCRLAQAGGIWKKAQAVAVGLTGAAFALLSALFLALAVRFAPRPEWLWAWTLPLGALGSAGTGWVFLRSAVSDPFSSRNWGRLSLSTLGFFLGLGALLANVGERELVDLKREVPRGSHVFYDELGRNLWSEWAYLNFMAPIEVVPVYDEEALGRALATGRKILVPGEDALKRLRQVAQGRFPMRRLHEARWRRWKLQGQDETGTPLWRKAWRAADLSLLERDYFVVFLSGAL